MEEKQKRKSRRKSTDEYLYMEEVHYGDGLAEVSSITIRAKGIERKKMIVIYVPPKTNTWRLEIHKEMQSEELKC